MIIECFVNFEFEFGLFSKPAILQTLPLAFLNGAVFWAGKYLNLTKMPNWGVFEVTNFDLVALLVAVVVVILLLLLLLLLRVPLFFLFFLGGGAAPALLLLPAVVVLLLLLLLFLFSRAAKTLSLIHI